MPKSTRFRQLESQVKLLRRHLLPIRFNPLGVYPQKIFTNTGAFHILVHAEIESYFEERCVEVMNYAIDNYKNRGKSSKVIVSLLAFSGRQMSDPPKSCNRTVVNADSLYALNKVMTSHGKYVNNTIPENHGIKEENLLKLLLPIGINVDDLDPFWLATMDDFGKKRGEIAHTSRIRMATLPNPADELSLVNRILTELQRIDELISSAKRT